MEHHEALLDVMAKARADLDAVVARYDDHAWTEDLGDRWRRKDVIAVRTISGQPLTVGEEVAAEKPWNLDRFNETMRERMWDMPVADIPPELKHAYLAVMDAVIAADDAECAATGTVWQVVDNDSAGHYRVHQPIPDRMHERWPEHVERVEDADSFALACRPASSFKDRLR